MKEQTKKDIIYYLRKAGYLLKGMMDRSEDESDALDELSELIAHIQAIEPKGESYGDSV